MKWARSWSLYEAVCKTGCAKLLGKALLPSTILFVHGEGSRDGSEGSASDYGLQRHK